MDLSKNIKQVLSVLHSDNSSSNKSGYILVTNQKVVFDNKIFVKSNNSWVQEKDDNLTNILLNIGLSYNSELDVLKNENTLLKDRINELESEKNASLKNATINELDLLQSENVSLKDMVNELDLLKVKMFH
ncbi:hypothetical protein RclHR1_00940015 [Rhizophagus clarus]|uniref:Uncharacterized protein n=1 Tax=Rhizophagus clarus TaxID=94130 RepID=A0A2Z6S4B9_9GLOM|nr:hypothetical protein RclHR1_00940015 [Rhizophagus clarus]GET00639.1 hypothetical protein RCL_jg1086.t1 [Rhizophagus clarus]